MDLSVAAVGYNMKGGHIGSICQSFAYLFESIPLAVQNDHIDMAVDMTAYMFDELFVAVYIIVDKNQLQI